MKRKLEKDGVEKRKRDTLKTNDSSKLMSTQMNDGVWKSALSAVEYAVEVLKVQEKVMQGGCQLRERQSEHRGQLL